MRERVFNLMRLKAERIAAGMTQEEVAKKLGKKRAWYAKKEVGITNVGVDDLVNIANVLNVEDISIFFTKDVPEKQQA